MDSQSVAKESGKISATLSIWGQNPWFWVSVAEKTGKSSATLQVLEHKERELQVLEHNVQEYKVLEHTM